MGLKTKNKTSERCETNEEVSGGVFAATIIISLFFGVMLCLPIIDPYCLLRMNGQQGSSWGSFGDDDYKMPEKYKYHEPLGFNGPLAEYATDGRINYQQSISGMINNSNEIQVGNDSTPEDDSILFYNISNGDGVFSLDHVTIAFAPGTQRPCIAFIDDLDKPLEGNEIEKVLTWHHTGDYIDIPCYIGDINNKTIIVNDCITTLRMEFYLNEEYCDENDLLYVYVGSANDINNFSIVRNNSIRISFRP